MNKLAFKGYLGSGELDTERGVHRGKLLFIDDLVTYEAATAADLRAAFEAAVDDYLETCRTLGREPQLPLEAQYDKLDQS